MPLLALFISFGATAQVNVSVEPVDGNAERPLYPFEVRDYRVVVFNPSDAAANSFGVEITAPPELSLQLNFSARQARLFIFTSIPPRQGDARTFQVQAVSSANKNSGLVAEFGEGKSKGKLSAKVIVAEAPVAVDAVVRRDMLSPTYSGFVVVKATNISGQDISGFRADLLSTTESFSNEPLEVPLLGPGESTREKEFRYSLPDSRQPLILKVLFEDSQGRHFMNVPLSEAPGDKGFVAGIMVGVVLLLVLFSLYGKKAARQGGQH